MQLLKTFISIRKSTSVRATKYFYLLILIILVLFLQAYMHNYNIVYMMMFFLVAVALVSTFFGVLNLYPLEVKFLNHSRFFVDKSASFSILIHNNSNRCVYDLSFTYKENEIYVETLQAYENKPLLFNTTFQKRGKQRLEALYLESLFPLFHEKKIRTFAIQESIVVYPQPQGVSLLEQLLHKKNETGDLNDFKGISRFVDGEGFSSIHWASLAKSETLMSKRFSYTQTKNKLHFSFSDLRGTTEEKLSQLTKWVLEASQYDFDFTLDLDGKSFDSTKEEVDEILTQLALY